MNVALIGFGAWGQIHAASISQSNRHSLVAIACHSPGSVEKASDRYPHAFISTEIQEVLKRPEVDVVDVVLPTHLHVPVAIEALRAGKHVLLEKPMAGTLKECDILLEEVKKHGLILTMVHELRCSLQWKWIHEAIQSGKIGTFRYGLFNLFRFPYRQGSQHWRYDRDKVGSWVLEEPIHFIDLMLWYVSPLKPSHVTARGNPSSYGLTQDFTAVFEFPNGAHTVVSQTLSGFQHHQVVEITGTEGALRSLWSGAMDRTDTPEFSLYAQLKGESAAHPIPIQEKSGELFEIQKYLDSALDGIEQGVSLYPPEEERELVRLCLEAERALSVRKRISL